MSLMLPLISKIQGLCQILTRIYMLRATVWAPRATSKTLGWQNHKRDFHTRMALTVHYRLYKLTSM